MRRVAALVVLALAALTACSQAVESSADVPPGVTPTAPAAQSLEPPALDDEASDNEADDDAQDPGAPTGPGGREIPPLVVPRTAPGSDEAYQDMIDELSRFLTPEQLREVPWPDLRNPDPIAAYMGCADFQNWALENNATPSLVEGYTAPNSPERMFDLDIFDFYNRNNVLSTREDPPYTMTVEGIVHPAATDINDALLRQVPDGSVAVVYYDSVGRSQLVDPDGNVFRENPGWTDLGPWVAIMAPTDVGWQVWWDELTETPPPGLDDDRGLPAERDRPLDL